MALREKYEKEVSDAMKARFGYKNRMAVPRLQKVVVHTSIGGQVAAKPGEEQKIVENVLADIALLAGQRGVVTKAKKSISGFKMRKGMPMGVMVTLRGKRMYEFLERLVYGALPRSRDFQGIPESAMDSHGNLTFGIKEQVFFPEILPEKTNRVFGLEVTVSTGAKNKEEGLALLRALGFPMQIAQHVTRST